MVTPLLIGCLTLAVNLLTQVIAVVMMLRWLGRKIRETRERPSFYVDCGILTGALMVLFAGHLVQIAVWALLFVTVGEFDLFATAFYHSVVNFSTLGYGDLVMSERWRLLGALEAASGVLMFGLSASFMFTLMSVLAHKRTSSQPE